MLLLALTLQLAPLSQVQPPVNNPRFIEIGRESRPQEVAVEDPDHPLPKRSTAWVLLGGYGMAGLGAGIGAVLGDAFSRSDTAQAGDVKNSHAGLKAMALGGIVGLIPGLIFGNEARKEQNGLARSVTLVLAAGGTLSIAFGANTAFNRSTF